MAQERKIGNSDKSPTAVEWLFDKLKSHFEHDGDLLEGVIMTVNQAKQMEKEQIMDAWIGTNTCDSAEQYYNEKYGNEGV